MSTNGDPNNGRLRWALTSAALAAGVGFLLWFTSVPDENLPRVPGQSAQPSAGVGSSNEPNPQGAAGERIETPPKVTISNTERARVTLEQLREGDTLVIGLAMPDDARGADGVSGTIVDVERRESRPLQGTPIAGEETGVRVPIDPEWLRPGIYMIQVKTHDGSHLPIRRYVLEVE